MHPLLWLVIAVGLYWLAKQFAKDVTVTPTTSVTGTNFKLNTKSTQEPIKLVYGLQRVGGNDVYGFTQGNTNEYLYLVQALAEGECDSINQVDSVDQIWFGDKLYTKFGGNITYTFHNGAPDQVVDPTLNAADPLWTDRMENTCYIMFKIKWNKDYFTGLPTKRQVELKGLKIHDIRSPGNPDAWSDNPVLCLYDYMTNDRYGMGIDAAKFDTASWSAAATYCDNQSFTCNLVVLDVKDVTKVIDSITKLFRGRLRWYDGTFYLVFSNTTHSSNNPVMVIEDKHVFQDESGKAAIGMNQPGRYNRPDGMKIKFVSKTKKFSTDDFIVGDQLGVVNDFELLGCTDRLMAKILGMSELERIRLDRTISGVFRDDCILLQPHDVVTFSNTTLGISDQEMRVLSANSREDNMVDLVLQYEDDEIYDTDYDVSIEDNYICDLPDPSDPPLNVINATIEEDTYYYRLVTYSKLEIDFDVPLNYPWYDHVEVWLAITEAGDPEPVQADYKHQFNTTNQFEIDPVEEGQAYWIVLRPVNYWGTKGVWDHSVKLFKIIRGKSSIYPESLESLGIIVNGDSVLLIADKLDDPDIEVYEFRYGREESTWDDAIFLASVRSPNYSMKGVKPGEHRFWANTLGSNGLYGAVPVSATGLVLIPKGWTPSGLDETDDYTDGTHVNTLRIWYDDWTDGAGWGLKCSHTGGDWSGTYESPVFDVGVLDDYYIYVDTEVKVTGAGLTWEEVFTIGDSTAVIATWLDLDIQTRTWGEIFEVEKSPKVRMKLRYSDTGVGDPDNWDEVTRMELCSTTVRARYFQVIIEIEDPSDEINALVRHFILKLYD